MSKDKRVASAVFQVFLSTMARAIKSEEGQIRSFDGDRVMGVFIGGKRFDAAARSGLKMSWAFDNVIVPTLQGAFSRQLSGYNLGYTTGIDAGEVWAIRGGVRNDSDLVWVGRAPNLGAKLSGLKTRHRTYITRIVYDRLGADLKMGGAPKRTIWEECTWTELGKVRLLRSSWTLPVA